MKKLIYTARLFMSLVVIALIRFLDWIEFQVENLLHRLAATLAKGWDYMSHQHGWRSFWQELGLPACLFLVLLVGLFVANNNSCSFSP